VSPEAEVTTQAREDISPNQDIRIVIDGITRFEGVTRSAGKINANGQVRLELEHPAAALFEETVSFSLTSPTDQEVLQAALNNAERGTAFSLSYAGTATSLNSDYEADERSVKSIFRDMTDRASRVWWVGPASTTINVETPGGRGTWESLDAQSDGVEITSFDAGSVDTVRNHVTVSATNGVRQTATAQDATSISEYGKRAETVNIRYADTESEAQAVADELLIPDPLPQGKLRVPNSVGNIVQPLANFTISLSDSTKGIAEVGLIIEQQTIAQGRATLQVGAGSGVDLSEINRRSKSREDTTEPGSIYDTPRIADEAITTEKLVAEAVIAAKIAAGTNTANEIASRTITANEIATQTITAQEVDTLTLEADVLTILNSTEESGLTFSTRTTTISGPGFPDFPLDYADIRPAGSLQIAYIGAPDAPFQAAFIQGIAPADDNTGTVGDSGESYAEMWAYDYFDANTGNSLQDEIDQNASDIASNDTDIADLEARVTDLENA